MLEIQDKNKYNDFSKRFLENKIWHPKIENCLVEGIFGWTNLVKEYIKKRVVTIGESMKTFWILDKNNIWVETDGKSTFLRILNRWFETQLKASKQLYELKSNIDMGDINNEANDENDREVDIQNQQENLQSDIQKKIAKYNRAIQRAQSPMWLKNIIECITTDIRDDNAFSKFNKNNDILSIGKEAIGGVLDLKTGEIRDRLAVDKLTYYTPIKYDPNANTSIIDSLFKDVFTENPEWQGFFQNWLGYLITGNNNLCKSLIIHGEGSNCKSIVDWMMRETFGKKLYYNMSVKGLTTKSSNNDYLYYAKDSRVLVVNETSDNDKFNWSMYKNISGDDTIHTMAKYKGPIMFDPHFKLVIITNHKPELPLDGDLAIKRRLIYLHFKKKYLDRKDIVDQMYWDETEYKNKRIGKKDKNLKSKLKKNLDSFMKWVIEGAFNYYKNDRDIKIPKSLQKHIIKELKENDRIKIFMTNYYKKATNENSETYPISLLEIYRHFIEETGIFQREYKIDKFEKRLKNLNYKIDCILHEDRRKKCVMNVGSDSSINNFRNMNPDLLE